MLGRGLSYDAPVTTFEAAAQSVLRRTAERLATRAQKRAQRATRAAGKAAPSIARTVLTVAAMGAFTLAASTFAVWTGLAVGGLCALYLAQAIGDD